MTANWPPSYAGAGFRPGLRLHVEVQETEAPQMPKGKEEWPKFFGSFRSGQPDLAERSSEILRAEFPGDR
jgi:hypothetical protein